MFKKFFQDRVETSLFRGYQVEKVWLYASFAKTVRAGGNYSDDVASSIAGLASNVVTAERHSEARLAAMSEDQIVAAKELASAALADLAVRKHAADAAWWLSQLRLLQGTLPDASSPTRHRVQPESYDDALHLIQRAVELGGNDSKYYTTLANTYIYGLDFGNAVTAAGEALILNERNAEARRLWETAKDLIKRDFSRLLKSSR